MPSEIRQISFRHVEVAEAVVEFYRRRGGITLPSGELLIEIVDTGLVSAIVTSRGQAAQEERLEVNSENLAAALILFCVKRHIPIPAKAEKRLQRVGDSVAIFIMRYHS